MTSRKATSMKGEVVDFDLFDIKNQMLQAPKSDGIKQRERFIDKKRRKSSKKRVDELLHQKKNNEAYVNAAVKDKDAIVVAATPAVEEDVVAELAQTEKTTRRKIVKNEN